MASFRALFQSLGLEMASPTSVDMRVVRAAYRRFLLAKHPDKCRRNEFEAEVKLVLADMRRYEARGMEKSATRVSFVYACWQQ